jgi:hypothetical protein
VIRLTQATMGVADDQVKVSDLPRSDPFEVGDESEPARTDRTLDALDRKRQVGECRRSAISLATSRTAAALLNSCHMSKEPSYEHAGILWVGGPAAAGKTTVSRLLARRHGLLWYSVDAYAFAHEKRAAAAGLHVMGTGPGDFDRRPMIMEDIQSLSVDTSVVVEGAFVTPRMAGVAENAVWLMPSREEQVARLERRHPDGVHDGYVWGWDLVRSQLEGTSASVIVVDGQTIEQTLMAVEQRFSAILGSCPAARTTDERQSLIRISNRQLAEQATERLRLGRHKENGRQAVHVFDCECAQANCTEVVELPVDEMSTLLAQAPPSIVSAEHSNFR